MQSQGMHLPFQQVGHEGVDAPMSLNTRHACKFGAHQDQLEMRLRILGDVVLMALVDNLKVLQVEFTRQPRFQLNTNIDNRVAH